MGCFWWILCYWLLHWITTGFGTNRISVLCAMFPSLPPPYPPYTCQEIVKGAHLFFNCTLFFKNYVYHESMKSIMPMLYLIDICHCIPPFYPLLLSPLPLSLAHFPEEINIRLDVYHGKHFWWSRYIMVSANANHHDQCWDEQINDVVYYPSLTVPTSSLRPIARKMC